jgi:hypothetical protein
MKLLCHGPDNDVVKWMLDNRAADNFGSQFFSAVVETDDGLQKLVWETRAAMENDLKVKGLL